MSRHFFINHNIDNSIAHTIISICIWKKCHYFGIVNNPEGEPIKKSM